MEFRFTSLFCCQNTGTEQHRHHTIEVALFNLFCILWEIETAQPYRMTKANDVYSGLGVEASYDSTAIEDLVKIEDDSNNTVDSTQDSVLESEKQVKGIPKTDNERMDSIPEGDEEGGELHVAVGNTKEGEEEKEKTIKHYKGTKSSTDLSREDKQRLQREVSAALQRAETIIQSYQDVKAINVFITCSYFKNTCYFCFS